MNEARIREKAYNKCENKANKKRTDGRRGPQRKKKLSPNFQEHKFG